jgi:ribosomal protein S18 acetylase RimI-like enzyme
MKSRAYVSMLAVTTEAEGSGVGKALLAAADDWARQRGYRHLALDTFGDNTHARAVYQRLGYQEESVRMVRLLD